MTSPPIFQSDTLILEINGEINFFGGQLDCGLQHVLPPPVRKHDLEVHISASSLFCVLTELSIHSYILSNLITQYFLYPPIGLSYYFPNYTYSFVPRNESLTISFPPYAIDLGVTFLNTSDESSPVGIPAISVNTTLQTSMINVAITPENFSVNGNVLLTSFSAAVDASANVPSKYLNQFTKDSFQTIINTLNSILETLPQSFTIETEILQLIELLTNDFAFDSTSDWVIIRANLKNQ
jgi:hypothetical protein